MTFLDFDRESAFLKFSLKHIIVYNIILTVLYYFTFI